MMMVVSCFGGSRRSAWWVVAVVAFESSSLSKVGPIIGRLPDCASEDFRAFARGNILAWSGCGAGSIHAAGVSQSPPGRAFAEGLEFII